MIDQQIEIERHVPTNIAKLATHNLKLEHRPEHSQQIESNRAYDISINYINVLKNISNKVQCKSSHKLNSKSTFTGFVINRSKIYVPPSPPPLVHLNFLVFTFISF